MFMDSGSVAVYVVDLTFFFLFLLVVFFFFSPIVPELYRASTLEHDGGAPLKGQNNPYECNG